jgi:hypothetical protein
MPYLLPTEKFQQKDPQENLVLELGTWGVAGVFVNALSNGIRKQPVFARTNLLIQVLLHICSVPLYLWELDTASICWKEMRWKD